MLEQHNFIRNQLGKAALSYDAELAERAANHSQLMATKGSLFHSDVLPGEGENVAAGRHLSEKEAVKLWWKSTGHRRNMLGNYSSMGYGSSENRGVIYYTVIFKR